jgi:hypothetical protein
MHAPKPGLGAWSKESAKDAKKRQDTVYLASLSMASRIFVYGEVWKLGIRDWVIGLISIPISNPVPGYVIPPCFLL